MFTKLCVQKRWVEVEKSFDFKWWTVILALTAFGCCINAQLGFALLLMGLGPNEN